jgi:2'-5' RNA ligase
MQESGKVKIATHRIFFALWPDDAIRQQIHRQIYPVFDHPQGRKVPKQNWHITLAFLGNVSQEVFSCVQSQVDMVTGKSFELVLDVIGHWSRPRVVWLGCNDKPAAVDALFGDLNQRLAACSYSPDYKIFKPHMTLMRKVTKKPKAFAFKPVHWQVDQFVLVESQVDNTGSTYKVIRSWNLAE